MLKHPLAFFDRGQGLRSGRPRVGSGDGYNELSIQAKFPYKILGYRR
jgi:hypothetical protein